MGSTPPTTGRGSEESHDKRDIRYGAHHSEPRPFTTFTEDNTELAKEATEAYEVTEETNRKSNLDSKVPSIVHASYEIPQIKSLTMYKSSQTTSIQKTAMFY